MRRLIEELRAEWREFDERIAAFDDEFAAVAKQTADCRRLCEIPGVGVLNATALVAAVGDASAFTRAGTWRPGWD